jgi:ATP-dependent helicase HrpA
LAWSALGPVNELVQDLVDSSLALAAGDCWKVRDADAFAELLTRVRSRIGGESRQQADVLNDIIPRLTALQSDIAVGKKNLPAETLQDVQTQIADLIYPGFLAELEPGHLQHFPRYVTAIEERLQQAAENPKRDLLRLREVQPFQQDYQRRLDSGADYTEALDQFRWLLAEYRVSVFAQRLGTAAKVSAKRLQQAWQEVLKSSSSR